MTNFILITLGSSVLLIGLGMGLKHIGAHDGGATLERWGGRGLVCFLMLMLFYYMVLGGI